MAVSKETLREISDFYKQNDGRYEVEVEYKIPGDGIIYPGTPWRTTSIYVDLGAVTPETTEKELKAIIYKAAQKQIRKPLQVRQMNILNKTISSENLVNQL